MDHRPRHHSAPDEGNQAVRGDIPDAPKADAAKALTVLLDGHRDDSLRLGFAVSLALFRSIDIGFVNLDRTGQQIPPGPDHRPAQLVQPSPSRLVTAEPKLPLQPECADPNLLAGHEPDRQKPHPQRFAGGLEDRARRQRCLAPACPTPQPSSRHRPRLLGRAAMATDEPVRPSQTPNVIPAGLRQCWPRPAPCWRWRRVHRWHRSPPYSFPEIEHFIDKLCSEKDVGNVTGAILLTNNNTDTKWWHRASQLAQAVCFTAGRINFYKSDGSETQPTNGQTFFYFGPDVSSFTDSFSEHGQIWDKTAA